MINSNIRVTLDTKLFKDVERRQGVSNFIGRQSKDFKNLTKRRQVESQAGGRLYRRKRGAGFTRAHRASARGQRPAPDTMTLVNAISDKKTGEFTAEVFIAPKVNPQNKQTADKYGAILQEKMDRPIMSENDAKEAQAKGRRDGDTLMATMV